MHKLARAARRPLALACPLDSDDNDDDDDNVDDDDGGNGGDRQRPLTRDPRNELAIAHASVRSSRYARATIVRATAAAASQRFFTGSILHARARAC